MPPARFLCSEKCSNNTGKRISSCNSVFELMYKTKKAMAKIRFNRTKVNKNNHLTDKAGERL